MKNVKITIQSSSLTIVDERNMPEKKISAHLRRFKRIKYNLVPKMIKQKEKTSILHKIDFKVEIKEAE
jgi:hypothetical protein